MSISSMSKFQLSRLQTKEVLCLTGTNRHNLEVLTSMAMVLLGCSDDTVVFVDVFFSLLLRVNLQSNAWLYA